MTEMKKRPAAKESRRPRVLITAGPTREYIDNVRFISNASSGLMGARMAGAFLRKKTDVVVVAGPCAADFPPKAELRRVTNAREMSSAVLKLARKADIFVAAAAVADYTPAVRLKNKLKKNGRALNLRMNPAPDILKKVSSIKFPGGRPVIVGFALEQRKKLLDDAGRKLINKKCDLIVANEPGAMESARASGYFIFADGRPAEQFRNLDKKKIAAKTAEAAMDIWIKRNS